MWLARGLALAFVAGSIGLIGPATGPAGAQAGCSPVTATGPRLSLEPRGSNALIADARVELPEPARVYLEYGNEQAGWLRTPTSEVADRHQIPLLRLRAGASYQVRAFALDGSGCPNSVGSGEVTTGQLPRHLQRLSIDSRGEPSFALALMDLRLPDSSQRWLVGIDPRGQVVWYYTIPADIPPGPPGGNQIVLIQRTNGNLAYLAGYWGIEEITPDGQLVRRFHADEPPAAYIHHDLIELPDGRIMFIGAEDRLIDDSGSGGPRDVLVRGDTLHVVNLDTGAHELVWNAFERLDIRTNRAPTWKEKDIGNVAEWLHLNSVAIGPRGNVVLTAPRIDQVISLSPDLRSVEWYLGGPANSFTFVDPADRFYGQHSAIPLSETRLLIFDNGRRRPEGPFARALELELDLATMTVHKAWEYRHQPDILAQLVSNAIRLPNGNTLVNFSYPEDPDDPVVLVETRPDGTVVWEQSLAMRSLRTTRYRAYPFTSLAGETAVEPTPVGSQVEAGRL